MTALVCLLALLAMGSPSALAQETLPLPSRPQAESDATAPARIQLPIRTLTPAVGGLEILIPGGAITTGSLRLNQTEVQTDQVDLLTKTWTLLMKSLTRSWQL